jgi:hypothetical protein
MAYTTFLLKRIDQVMVPRRRALHMAPGPPA